PVRREHLHARCAVAVGAHHPLERPGELPRPFGADDEHDALPAAPRLAELDATGVAAHDREHGQRGGVDGAVPRLELGLGRGRLRGRVHGVDEGVRGADRGLEELGLVVGDGRAVAQQLAGQGRGEHLLAAVGQPVAHPPQQLVGKPPGEPQQQLVARGGAGAAHGSASSTTSSTSTGTPSGSSATPTADRACLPASPKTSASTSEAPLMTFGCSTKPGADATNPTTFTTPATASMPTSASTAASAFSAQIRARPAASSVLISAPTLPSAAGLPSTSGTWPAVNTSEPERRAGM